MALIHPNSVCAICGEKLDRPYTATSGVAFPREHRLYRYCDAPLHYDCFETWADRKAFAGRYFEGRLHSYRVGITGHLLAEGMSWALICGPYNETDLRPAIEAGVLSEKSIQQGLNLGDKPNYVTVALSEWLARLSINWADWEIFVGGKYREDLEGRILHDVEQVMRDVRQVAPDSQTLEKLLMKSSVE